jgi:multidrug resistance efflux pump
MKKRQKIIIAMAGVLVVAAALLSIRYFSRDPEASSLRTTGIIDGTEVNLSPKVAGRISSICCNEGDRVRKGQVAVALESDDIQASVRQALAGVERARSDVQAAVASAQTTKANLAGAEADVRSAEADLARAREQMEEAKTEADRREELFARNLIPKEARDQAVSAYRVNAAAFEASNGKLEAARAKRDAAAGQIDAAQSRVNASRAAQKESEANLAVSRSKLADTTIAAPIAGTVIFKAFEPGETVSPGETILTVVALDNLYARIDIDETNIGNVVLQGDASVTVEGVPGKVFRGRITEIGRYAGFATQRDVIRGREDIKTFRVKVRVDDPSGILKPGMTVDVEIPKKR